MACRCCSVPAPVNRSPRPSHRHRRPFPAPAGRRRPTGAWSGCCSWWPLLLPPGALNAGATSRNYGALKWESYTAFCLHCYGVICQHSAVLVCELQTCVLLRARRRCRFAYEEEAAAEEFFVPYVWSLAVQGGQSVRGHAWNLSAVALFPPAEGQPAA